MALVSRAQGARDTSGFGNRGSLEPQAASSAGRDSWEYTVGCQGQFSVSDLQCTQGSVTPSTVIILWPWCLGGTQHCDY